MPFAVALALWAPSPVRADVDPLLLFGGPERDHFLGCLNCDPSELFSVWNEEGDYGSTTRPDSIWNREGVYGSPASPLSPWSRHATTPPFVVDREGNFFGYFTRDLSYPDRITRTRAAVDPFRGNERRIFEFLAWFLEDYDLIIANLDEIRANR
jgi:hypothetical protein